MHRSRSLSPDGLPGDLEFYLGLARQARPPVLELGCGTGRLTIPIARAGVSIVGLDCDPDLLDVARCRSEGAPSPRWLRGDMRSLALGERFGLIFLPFRGFSYLLTPEDQRAALDSAFEHLLPGGQLALDVFNPSVLALLARSNRPPAAGPILSRVGGDPRRRYADRSEMERLLRRSGFEVEALYGGFDRSEIGTTSTTMVWLARKPVPEVEGRVAAPLAPVGC